MQNNMNPIKVLAPSHTSSHFKKGFKQKSYYIATAASVPENIV